MSKFLARLTLSSYRMAGSMIYPFMGPFLMIRARKGKEDRTRRYERYGYPSAEKPKGPIVWFHAASIGESMAVIPLIQRVSELGINAIMTTGTVTSAEIVKSRLPPSTYHQYVPLDLIPAVKRFLDHWQPDLAVFTESEIWPMTVLELGKRGVPQVLVNARMSDKSFTRWQGAHNLAEALFDNFSHVIAQSESDATRFKNLGARPVLVSGNLKVDTEALPVAIEELNKITAMIGPRPVWLAASTHDGEEELAATVHQSLKARLPNLLTIIVPRHPDRAEVILETLAGKNLAVSSRSKNEPIGAQTDIYMGDTIGEMGLYLRLAPLVFVGRSIIGTGGQNPLEPAMTGTAIISGKNVHNFRDSYKFLLENGGVRLVSDGDMLAANVEFLLTNTSERNKMIEAARQTVEGMRGALNNTTQILDSYLFPLTVERDLQGMR